MHMPRYHPGYSKRLTSLSTLRNVHYNPNSIRDFHSSPVHLTDGVYKELTSMRVRTPWVEALRMQEQNRSSPTKESTTLADSANRDLSPKKMSDSFVRVVIPLAQDPWLLDNYLNANGNIRIGRLFMDLDALAGVIAYKHTGESVTTVTAAVDRITIKNQLKDLCDLEFSGQVTYATGRSSMEVSLQVAQAPEIGRKVKEKDVLMTCAFTMVSLNPSTKKPISISPLQLDTAEEKRLYTLGEKKMTEKKALAKTALRKQAPNDEESDHIHAMWLRQLEYHDPNTSTRKPDNLMYMSSTTMHSSQIMQPQYRNRHNFMIFGGFLLKQTFELAFCCCAAFAHCRPVFLSLDPSTFENPVPVGSVLYLTATVAYTDPPLISPTVASSSSQYTRVQVRIDSKIRNVEHGETKPTGQFNYTFLVEKDVKVMPQTYSEFMIWTDARRRAAKVRASMNGEGNGENGEKASSIDKGMDGGQEGRVTE